MTNIADTTVRADRVRPGSGSLAGITRVVCVAVVAVASLLAPASASAVVPGANGQILFTRQICSSETDPCWELVVADAADAHETIVAGPYARDVWDDHFVANWSPDGRRVIFMADLGAGQRIWEVNADGTGMHSVFTPPAGTFLDDGAAFTPDGGHIVFTRCCPQPSGYGLWKINADGSRLRIVTTEAVGPNVDGPSNGLAQVSPDGRWIAFIRNLNFCGCYVATVNFAGGRLRQLTDLELNGQIPNWSPDGRRIVFQALGDVWAVNPDGTDITQLTFDGASLNPSYSPDGTKIIFSHRSPSGERDLYTMNPDGTGVTQLTHTDDSERFPQWAPA